MTKPRLSVSTSLADRGRPEMWANETEAAVLCGMSPDRFRASQRELEARGFPAPVGMNGKRFIPHIITWCEREADQSALKTDPQTVHDEERAKERFHAARPRQRIASAG